MRIRLILATLYSLYKVIYTCFGVLTQSYTCFVVLTQSYIYKSCFGVLTQSYIHKSCFVVLTDLCYSIIFAYQQFCGVKSWKHSCARMCTVSHQPALNHSAKVHHFAQFWAVEWTPLKWNFAQYHAIVYRFPHGWVPLHFTATRSHVLFDTKKVCYVRGVLWGDTTTGKCTLNTHYVYNVVFNFVFHKDYHALIKLQEILQVNRFW